jgi:CDP-glycerol glycerophosphotransferase (TagB/SpsB family)
MLKRIIAPLFNILTPLNNVIAKKKRIVLYSNLGFRDNVLSLANYLIEHHVTDQYECVFISNKFYRNFKGIKNVKVTSPLLGIYYFLTSKYFFYCFGKYPIKPSAEQIVVNLGHGMPIKKIGNSEEKRKNIDYNYFNYVLSYSPYFDQIIMDSFGAEGKQIMHFGAPRNDELFVQEEINEEPRKVIWMPTYQEERTAQFLAPFTDKQDLDELDAFLQARNCILYIKPHPLEKRTFSKSDTTNIKIITDDIILQKYSSLYTCLAEMSGLITDYSSISIDYLLLNRPIAYIFSNEAVYRRERGFNFDDLDEITAGVTIKTIEDFNQFIDVVCRIQPDSFINKRKTLIGKFHKYRDGDNTHRILESIGISDND